MFELPDAKRVRREDLQSDSEDEAPVRDDEQDAELLAKLHARMAGMIDLGSLEQPPAPTPKKKDDKKTTEDDEDATMGDAAVEQPAAEPEEFEFRLFSTAPATKIALVDEDERAMEGDGDMVRKRPLSYYIAGEPSSAAKEEFAAAAVSGEDVLERAKQRWWGMEMPWRVTTIPAGETKKKGGAGGEGEEEAARRRRPGKKKRIALRMKEREKKKKAEEAAKAKMGKEEALKEKKKRLNRAKKLRKRAKAKEAKAAGGDGGDGAEEESGDSSDSGDE